MVSSSSLIEFLSDKTGYNKHSLDRIGVELRRAGVLHSKGRGCNALNVELKNVADLIFAMLGSNSCKDAPDAVTRFGNLINEEGIKLSDFFLFAFEKHAESYCIEYIEFSRMSNTAFCACSFDGGIIRKIYDFGVKEGELVNRFDVTSRMTGLLLQDILGYIK